MGIFDDLFGGGKNPADAAMPYYKQIAPMERQNYNPYIQRGNAAYDIFNPIYSSMASDPAAFLQKMMGGYTASKDYQLKRDEMNRAAGNTAAAGGMRGSLSDISNEARIDDYLMGQDMQNWLANVMKLQGAGLEGEQHLYDTGFNATQGLTSDLANIFGTQGQLAFQGQRENNQSRNDWLEGIMKGIGTVGGFEMPTGGQGGSIFGRFASKFF